MTGPMWLPNVAAESSGLVLPNGDPATPAEGPRVIGVELSEFLDQVPPEPDWLVPGLLERQDRMILTGAEGKGKSTLLRQMGVQLASGIHPFGGPEFPPLRVLLFDLENTKRQIHRKIHPLYLAADSRYKGDMTIAVRSEGLDLTEGDGEVLEAEVAAARPDVLITGPSYKMAAGDPTEEGPARLVASWLDKLRTKYGCAVFLEAHQPHASNGGKRPLRPYGASLWVRWPEFGLHLGDTGQIQHWRGQRDERDWPAVLQRGGAWPWTPLTRDRDLLWARIVDYCQQLGERPSVRELAKLTGSAQTTVQRAIDEHRNEWDALDGTDS
ncbi:AAA family ATPase [Streptomyces liliifuscus]|uniref:AAA family ATPase n=1 Tax=Streptomyces liliifuscus TaxID=2797636 RepID=A0A7T7I8J0_9ACTN|nr:AAA family ATPase [Streptomyces liliifuscus]QQM42823.1 AAA family ATPase [Streptomyces liliifuscus]